MTICNPSRLSVALRSQGFEKGNKIHIVTNNNIHYHSLLLAVWRLGGVTSCGESALNAETIHYQVTNLAVVKSMSILFLNSSNR